MPVASVAIFPAHTNFTKKIRTCLLDSGLDLETDDNNDINLDLNADTIFPDWIYLKWWKDPDKAGCLPQRGQGGAGKRKVLQLKTLQ